MDAAKKAAAAGDVSTAIGMLLTSWQSNPAPAIADALDRITASALQAISAMPSVDDALEDPIEVVRAIGRLREGNAATAAGVIAKVRNEKDPRIASALVDLLEDPPWHATGSQPFWTKLFALLAKNPDPRSPPRLKKINYTKIINGKSMQGWMTAKVAKVLAEAPPAFTQLSAKDLKTLDGITLAKNKVSRPETKPNAKRISEAALFKAVYDDPADDAARAVLADFLLEKQDPRGELISLQLSAAALDADGEKRALAIVRKHQKAWLGEIAPHVKYIAYPSVSAIDPLGISMWWRRGFLTGCMVRMSKAKLATVGLSPLWSTIERARLSLDTPKTDDERAKMSAFLENMRALKVLDRARMKTLDLVIASPAVANRIQSLNIGDTRGELERLNDALEKLPGLRELRLIDWGEGETPGSLFPAAHVLQRLVSFALEHFGELVAKRATTKDQFDIAFHSAKADMAAMVERFAALAGPIGRVTFEKTPPKVQKELEAALRRGSKSKSQSKSKKA